MSTPRRLPKLCIHRGTRQYYVKLSGVRHYLGKVGGPDEERAAEQARLRVLAEHAAGGEAPAATVTVAGLVTRWLARAAQLYRQVDGSPTCELQNVRTALTPLVRLYGPTPAGEFRPKMLKAYRQVIVDGSWMTPSESGRLLRFGRKPGRCRKSANRDVNRVRRMFKWGVGEELVPEATHAALMAVDHIAAGTGEARETHDVPPADEAAVEAALGYLNPVVRAMVELQLLTGARPGEVCRLRPCDLVRTPAELLALLRVKADLAGVWLYCPPVHKAAKLGRKRVIPIGPRALDVLAPFLEGRSADALCFTPREAVELSHALRRAGRRTRVQPSQVSRKKPDPKRRPGECYTPEKYAAAVSQALARRNRDATRGGRPAVEPFHPHQLRHNACDRLVDQFGWEVARIVLGHRHLATTRIYAQDDIQKAVDAARKSG